MTKRNITLRLPEVLIERAERIVERQNNSIEDLAYRVSVSAVLRHALALGLPLVEEGQRDPDVKSRD